MSVDERGITIMRFRSTLTAALVAATCALAGCATQVQGTAAGTPSGSATSIASSAAGSSTVAESSASGPSSSDAASSGSAASSAPAESTAGSGTQGSDGSTATSPSSASDAGKADIVAFGGHMAKAVAGVTSMRGAMTMKAGPVNETGTFVGTMADGKTTAFDMTMSLDNGGQKIDLHMLSVGGKSYLGPSATLRQMGVDTGGKPWVLLSGSSSNQVLAQMSQTMGQAMDQTGPAQYTMMVKAATDLTEIGPDTVDGVAATHYRLTVDLAKMAAAGGTSDATAAAAAQAGLTDIPLDVWLDSEYRPVKVQEKFSVQGQEIEVLVTMGAYNKPVTISAPPAKDVAKG